MPCREADQNSFLLREEGKGHKDRDLSASCCVPAAAPSWLHGEEHPASCGSTGCGKLPLCPHHHHHGILERLVWWIPSPV